MSSVTDTADIFDIVENANGELLIALFAFQGDPEESFVQLFPDDYTYPILHKSKSVRIGLPQIPVEALEKLSSVSEVLVVEMDGTTIKHSYTATVNA